MADAKKDKYCWYILGICLLICSSIGIYSSSSSVFLVPICSELGFDRGTFVLSKTLVSLTAAFLSPLIARYTEKHSIRILLIISTMVGSLSYLGYSVSSKLWQFYLCALVNGFVVSVNGFVVVGIIINRWFVEKRSTVSGIAYAGSGLGAAVVIKIAGKMISSVGWRATYRVLSVAGAVLLIPVLFFVFKDYPENIGLKPYGEKTETVKEAKGESEAVPISEIRKSTLYRILAASLVAIYGVSVCANNHTVAYLQDEGYSSADASGVMSFVMIVLMVAKIVVGIIYDRFGTRVGNVFVGTCAVVYPFLALFAESRVVVYTYAIMYGIGSTTCSVPVSILIQKHFNNAEFGRIFSRINMLSVITGAVMSPIMGYAFDFTSSYRSSWIVLATISVIAGVLLIYTDYCETNSKLKNRF